MVINTMRIISTLLVILVIGFLMNLLIEKMYKDFCEKQNGIYISKTHQCVIKTEE